MAKLAPTSYLLRSHPGLRNIMLDELRHADVTDKQTKIFHVRQRNYDLLLLAGKLLKAPPTTLRVPEQLLECVTYGKFKFSKSQIERIASRLKSNKRHPYRLNVSVDGKHFSRSEFRHWLAKQLEKARVVLDDDAPQSIWVFCIDESFYVGLEMTNFAMVPQRNKRRIEREGSLPTTIASAMAFLADLSPGESVLDPVCGSGSLLVEAHGCCSGVDLIGIDIDRDAIKAAKLNMSYIHGCKLNKGDATRIELPDGSCDVFLANLPFGKQFGSTVDNPNLYRDILKEMSRLASPKGRAVMITSDVAAMDKAIDQIAGVKLKKRIKVKIRGTWAEIFVLNF